MLLSPNVATCPVLKSCLNDLKYSLLYSYRQLMAKLNSTGHDHRALALPESLLSASGKSHSVFCVDPTDSALAVHVVCGVGNTV